MKPSCRRVTVREGYDGWSRTYDHIPNPLVLMDDRHTLALLRPAAGERVLDAGCGTGRHLGAMLAAGSRPCGLDFSCGMLRVTRRKFPRAAVAIADLEQPLPVRSRRFDAVLCALVGEHLRRLPALFREMHAALRPGGRVVFSVFHPEMVAAGKEARFEDAGVEFRLGAEHHTVADYATMLDDAGFREVGVHEFRGDPDLATAAPNGAKYVGAPILLVVRGAKRA